MADATTSKLIPHIYGERLYNKSTRTDDKNQFALKTNGVPFQRKILLRGNFVSILIR